MQPSYNNGESIAKKEERKLKNEKTRKNNEQRKNKDDTQYQNKTRKHRRVGAMRMKVQKTKTEMRRW